MAKGSKKKENYFSRKKQNLQWGFNSFFKKLEQATPVNREGKKNNSIK